MFRATWATGLILVSGCLLGSCSRPAPQERSVVLVTLDTTRADRIGAFGGRSVPTPNLDSMARDGVAFQQAIAQVPLTLPSHSSIFTAQYPGSHGVHHNGIFRLPDEATTLAEHLKGAGLHTAAVVGAYVLNKEYGLAQGFDFYEDIPEDRTRAARENQYEAQRTAEEVNERVFHWLDSRPQGRFFLWVHYYDPHEPYAPPEGSRHALQGAGYDREISYIDACFGDLVSRLRKEALLDDTILVVAGDHGESLGQHLEVTHGLFLYDGAIRVPMFIRAPGLVGDGSQVESPVELVDLVPTLLDLLELPPLPEAQGKSLVPRIQGEDDPAALAFAATEFPRLEFGWSDLSMVRSSRFKYIQAPKPELYDLQKDPGEVVNLYAEERDRAFEMAQTLEQWAARAKAGSSGESAARVLAPEELSKLQSLGYLSGGGAAAVPGAGGLPDPKDKVEEGRLITLSRDLMRAGRTEDALDILDGLLAANPNNHLLRSSRVQAHVRLKRFKEAEDDALAALAAASQSTVGTEALVEKARRMLASVYWLNGKNALAEEQYRLAIDLNQRNKSAPVFPGLLLGAAGGVEEARKLVDDVLARNPSDPAALAANFELAFAKEETQAALRAAEELVRHRAGDPDTLVRAGRLARDAGSLDLALSLFEIADRKKPGDPDILGHLATARITRGDLQGAEEDLRRVRTLRPKDPRAPFYLANIALLRNKELEARALVNEALALDPQFVPPLLNLARWLGEKGRIAEARTVTQDALRRRPDDEEARAMLGRLDKFESVPGGAR